MPPEKELVLGKNMPCDDFVFVVLVNCINEKKRIPMGEQFFYFRPLSGTDLGI